MVKSYVSEEWKAKMSSQITDLQHIQIRWLTIKSRGWQNYLFTLNICNETRINSDLCANTNQNC